MISIDALIMDFLKGNVLTVTAIYMILRGIAAESPWTWDEKIIAIIGSAFDIFKPDRKIKIQ